MDIILILLSKRETWLRMLIVDSSSVIVDCNLRNVKRPSKGVKLELEFLKYKRVEKAYLGHSRTSTMGIFCDIVDVVLGSKYDSIED